MKRGVATTETWRKRRRLSIVAAYRSGAALQEVGDAFKISRERVRQIVAQDAPSFRRVEGTSRPGTVDPLKLIALADQGLSVDEIARRLGIARSVAYRCYYALGYSHGVHWTAETALAELRTVAEQLGRSPKQLELRTALRQALKNHCGGLTAAKREIGLASTDRGCAKRRKRGETYNAVRVLLTANPALTPSELGRLVGLRQQGMRLMIRRFQAEVP